MRIAYAEVSNERAAQIRLRAAELNFRVPLGVFLNITSVNPNWIINPNRGEALYFDSSSGKGVVQIIGLDQMGPVEIARIDGFL